MFREKEGKFDEIQNLQKQIYNLSSSILLLQKENRAFRTQLLEPIVNVETNGIKVEKMTLRGKVNAIAEHLKIELDVAPPVPARITVKKIKSKKRGK